MANDQPQLKIIIGIPKLSDYLKVSPNTVYKYLNLGMPGNKINETWHFHIDNINEWFKIKTFVIRKDLSDEIARGASSDQHNSGSHTG
jgi:hypothetical protein